MARLKERRINSDREIINSNNPSKVNLNKLRERNSEDISDVRNIYSDILKLYDELKLETVHTASVKRAFANFLYAHFYYRNVDWIEKYYSESIEINKKLLTEKNEKTLSATFEFAEYYFQVFELEKALELFEKYIRIVEENYGKEHKLIVPALQYYQRILTATEQIDESEKIAARINKISPNKEEFGRKLINISARSKDSKLNLERGIRGHNPVTADEIKAERFKNFSTIEQSDVIIKIGRPVISSDDAIEVLIDENGNVESAKASGSNKKLSADTEKAVLKWKFRPFVYKGTARKLKGFVIYLN